MFLSFFYVVVIFRVVGDVDPYDLTVVFRGLSRKTKNTFIPARDEGIMLPRYHPSSRKMRALFLSVTGEARSVFTESSKVKGLPHLCALFQPVKDISVPRCARFAAFS